MLLTLLQQQALENKRQQKQAAAAVGSTAAVQLARCGRQQRTRRSTVELPPQQALDVPYITAQFSGMSTASNRRCCAHFRVASISFFSSGVTLHLSAACSAMTASLLRCCVSGMPSVAMPFL